MLGKNCILPFGHSFDNLGFMFRVTKNCLPQFLGFCLFFSALFTLKANDEVIVIPLFLRIPIRLRRRLLDEDLVGTRGRPRWHRDRVRRVPRQLLPQGVCVVLFVLIIIIFLGERVAAFRTFLFSEIYM